MNQQNEKKFVPRVKTEQREEQQNGIQYELDNLVKIAKIKLENLIKRQSNEWKELYDLFEQFKKSSSLEVMKMNEANFLIKMEEVIKNNTRIQENSTERYRLR